MTTGAQVPAAEVDSRWWYWIAAYPIVALLALPFAFVLLLVFVVPIVVLDAAGGHAAAPFVLGVILVVAVVAFSFVMIGLAIFVMLPVALYFDAKAVAEGGFTWKPDPLVYALVGVLQFIVTPLIGLIVAIYYLYRRHTAVGVP